MDARSECQRWKVFQRALLASAVLLATAICSPAGEDGVKSVLEKIREKHRLPSLASIAMIDGKVLSLAATGVRKEGSPVEVTPEDIWHIGSDTKSMTATLAAMFVEQGRLKWETKIADIFPELQDRMKPAWREVSIEQLLTHRSGAPGAAPPDLWVAAWRRSGSPVQQRLSFVQGLLGREPEAAPGTQFIYSNQGYAIAGAMLERIAGKPWETLMQEMLFDPLGMKTAGFGAPATVGKIDQPWGHSGGKAPWQPVAPGPEADNPPAIGPAGTVHCSLTDLARYADMHAKGENAGFGVLKPASFVKLHTPPAGSDYAFGWGVAKRPWAGGNTLSHAGSNTMFYVIIWVAPAKDAVFIAATNAAGDEAEKAGDEAVSALIRKYLPETPNADGQ